MFIGHLPGAYLALRPFQRRLPAFAFVAGLVGGVLPDIDMLWFYLVDDRAHHHHQYLTHRPIIWAMVAGFGVLLQRILPKLGLIVAMVGFGALVHMCLDSIAGAVSWGWPIVDTPVTLVRVEATHDHWIKSFLSHWTFKVEIGVCLLALIIWWRSQPSVR